MKKKITIQQVILKVRELAKKSPRNKYKRNKDREGCFYTEGKCTNGSTGCIFGQALKELKISKTILNKFDEDDNSTDIYKVMRSLTGANISQSLDMLNWCNCVQGGQDRGDTWSKAIKDADTFHSIEAKD